MKADTERVLEVKYKYLTGVAGDASSCFYFGFLVKDGMPSAAEFATCLHKIKCGFNILVCVSK